MGQKMTDSMREAVGNPAFQLVAWAAVALIGVVISLGTYLFTRADSDTQKGREELTQSINDLRVSIREFSKTLQDQQTSMLLMQSRVANLETVSSATRDGLSKVRDDVHRDTYRIDRLEDASGIRRTASRGAR